MNIHIPADFTLNELQAFIDGQETAEPPEGYYTAEEWASHFEIYITKMRKILRRAKDKELLDMTHIYREALDGKPYKVAVYALRGKDISDSQESMD